MAENPKEEEDDFCSKNQQVLAHIRSNTKVIGRPIREQGMSTQILELEIFFGRNYRKKIQPIAESF